MSRTYKDSPNSRNNRPKGGSRQRQISVRAVRRDPPDLRKLSRALISLAMDEAAAEADPTKATSIEQSQTDTGETETAADD